MANRTLDPITGQPAPDPEQVKRDMDKLRIEMIYAASSGLCLPSVNLAEVDPASAAKISRELGRLIRTLGRKGITPEAEEN